jgi:hypothetical protein
MKCLRWMPLLFILLTSSEAVSGENDSLKHENQLLETELRIAQTPQIYSIFDLKNKKICLKARGLLLRELSIEAFRVWGNLPAVKAATLIRKSALFPPKRVLVNPKASDDEAQRSVETLELKDMPTNYTLVLGGNISISVRPKPTHLLSSLWSIRYPVQWYLARPVLTVWHALWRKPFTSMEIVLEESDARSLYWSFLEGMKAIVFSPGSRP